MDNGNGKQKLITKIVCVLLSIGLWFYVTNIENPIKTYDMSKVPVELLNTDTLQQAGLALAPNQQFYVSLKLEGQSQDIFKVDRSDFKVTVDLSEFVFKVGENKVLVNIIEAPDNISIKNSNGLTITLNIESYVTKEVSVKSKIEVISKSSYYVATPIFDPNTVTVSGPESLINRVDKVIAEGQESNAVETIVKDYSLIPVDENDMTVDGVELSQDWSEATILINEGKAVPINVVTKGELPQRLRIKSIEPSVKEVGITGPEGTLSSISEIQTEPIDLSQITDNTTIDVSLGIPNDILIQSGDYSITVNISVEKVKSKEFTIGYKLTGETSGIQITPVSDKITITVSGYDDKLNLLNDQSFTAVLDVAEFVTDGTYTKAPVVKVVNEDSEIKIDNISKVEFKVTTSQQDTSGDSTTTDAPVDSTTDSAVNSNVDNNEQR